MSKHPETIQNRIQNFKAHFNLSQQIFKSKSLLHLNAIGGDGDGYFEMSTI